MARDTACCTWWALDVLHVTCTWLRPGHLSVRVGDGSRRSEEIVEKSGIAPLNVIIIIQGCRFSVFPFFCYFWPDPFSADLFPVFSPNCSVCRKCMLIFSIFSYFIFLFLNFLSLFVFIFCETARTHRFAVIFAKVQWHPWLLLLLLLLFWCTHAAMSLFRYLGKWMPAFSMPTSAMLCHTRWISCFKWISSGTHLSVIPLMNRTALRNTIEL